MPFMTWKMITAALSTPIPGIERDRSAKRGEGRSPADGEWRGADVRSPAITAPGTEKEKGGAQRRPSAGCTKAEEAARRSARHWLHQVK